MHKKSYFPYLLLVCSSAIFGFSFLFTKTTLAYLDVFQLLGIRFLLAAALMSIIAATRLVKLSLTRKKLKGILLLALFQPTIYFVCETFGIKMTSSSESGMMIAIIPIVTAFFSGLILKEKLIARQWIFIFVSVLGVALIIFSRGIDFGSGAFAGFMLLLGAVIAAGLYGPMSRRLSAHSSPFEITFVMIWVGAIVFNAIGLSTAAQAGRLSTYFSAAFTPGALTGVLYLGTLSSVVAFFIINFAVSRVRASKTSVFANLTTVISILAGVLIAGEKILALQIIGILLILISIWGVVSDKIRLKKAPQPIAQEPTPNAQETDS
jgi:drug/metabolite transporter (DMT)-like permease